VKAAEAEKIKEIHTTLEALLQDSTFFIYEDLYKRYRLAQEVEFEHGEYEIDAYKVKNYEYTRDQLIQTGEKLHIVLDTLLNRKHSVDSEKKYDNVSYTMIITGRASKDGPDSINYPLSYNRAYELYKFWKNEVEDFDSEKYQEIIDLQIAGVGEGGLGRFENDVKNRSFFIQIIPKIGEIKNK
jgi:hypothetical protein